MGPKDKGLISKKWEWLWSNDIDNESIHKKSKEFLKYLYQLGLKRIEMVLIKWVLQVPKGFPSDLRWWRVCLQCGRPRFDPCIRKIPWRRKQQPTPVFMPGKSQDGGAWPATVQGVTKSQTQLRDFTFTFTFQTPKLLWVERKLKNLLSCKYGLFLTWEKNRWLQGQNQDLRGWSQKPQKSFPETCLEP